jgi:Tfp pilus assembly protein PilE
MVAEPDRRMNSRAFSILDVLVTLFVITLLLAVTIAARQKLAQADAITGCQANLKQLHQALTTYADQNDGAFPRTRATPGAPLTAYTGADAADPFSDAGPAANDVTAPAFLLARENGLSPSVFICPGALRNGLAEIDSFDAAMVKIRSNFRVRINYNYSLTNMYPDAAATASGYSLDRFVRLGSAFAIAADTNPGDETINPQTNRTNTKARMANSPNHRRDGQNVLCADGSMRFVPVPYAQGADTSFYASAGVFPQPATAEDSVLLPVWAEGPQRTPAAVKLRRWVFVGALIFSTALIGGAIIQGIRRRRN